MLKVIDEEKPELAKLAPEELERLVDEDIQSFDAWFQKKQAAGAGPEERAEPLVRSERAILKMYLYWKTKGATDA